MRVLVAEDDTSVARALVAALQQAQHTAHSVPRGSDVLLQHHDADLLLLDLGLEDMDGFTVLQRLRAVSDIPVVVVTARGDEHSTVRALRSGADDYLVKPVRLHELLARLEAVGRRHSRTAPAAVIDLGWLHVDVPARRATAGGEELALTPTEFALLSIFARHAGQAVSREKLQDEVWGDAYAANSRAFDVHLAQLRQKLPDGAVITTIRGFGYRLDAAR